MHAEPRLHEIAEDPLLLRALTADSITGGGASGLCRVAALMARAHGFKAASDQIAQRMASLGKRTDEAARIERDAAPKVLAVLRETDT